MRHLKVLASSLAIVLLLVMATDYVAIAATGKPVILGKLNTAGKTTIIKSGTGPALKLVTKPGKPPLAVKRSVLVKKLNADKVDGKSASELGVRTQVYSIEVPNATRSNFVMTIPDVQAGTYLATMDGWIYAPAGNVHCYLRVPGGLDRPQDFVEDSALGFYAISASGVVAVSATADLAVRCQGTNGSWRTYQDFQVTLTPIDVITELPSSFVRPSVAGRSATTTQR